MELIKAEEISRGCLFFDSLILRFRYDGHRFRPGTGEIGAVIGSGKTT